MMTKRKSSPRAALKYLFIVPVAIASVAVFAAPNVSETLEQVSATNFDRLLEQKEKKDSGIVLQKDSKSLELLDVKVKTDDVMFYANKMYMAMPENPIYIVNDKEVESLEGIDSHTIEEMTVLNEGTEAAAAYGEKAKNGVVLIALNEDRILSPTLELEKSMAIVAPKPADSVLVGDINGLKIWSKNKIDGKPTILVDGKKVESMSAVDPNNIESISVLKDKAAENIYGEKAKNGVIIVTTKGGKSDMRIVPDDVNILVDTRKQVEASGIVKDADGKPIIGAIISVEGSNQGVVTDMEGRFSFKIPENSTLQVRGLGLKTQTVKAKESLEITLMPE